MAVVKTTTIPLDVNTTPGAGAINISPNNAQMEINLEQGIIIPSDAFNASVSVEEATIWNTVHNISAGLGNNTMYIFEDGVVPPNTVVTIPDGSYSTPSLSAAIDREYTLLGGTTGLIFLDEDFATQRVVIILDGTLAGPLGAQLDFTPGDTPREVLGFASKLVPTVAPTTLVHQETGANTAAFNNIEYFLIHWNGSQGIRVNNSYEGVLSRVNITAPPGSQIVHAPLNPAISEIDSWVGTTTRNMVFWITDQNNVQVDTNEIWSARLNIQYQTIQKVS